MIDQLTKVLVGLYEEPEKPGNAIEYVNDFKVVTSFFIDSLRNALALHQIQMLNS